MKTTTDNLLTEFLTDFCNRFSIKNIKLTQQEVDQQMVEALENELEAERND